MAAAVIAEKKVVPVPRRITAPLVAALLLPLLAACGSASTGLGGKTASDFSAVSVSGSVGSAPHVTWKSQMTTKSTVTKTLVKGSGATLQNGGSAYGYIWLGNGFSKQKAFSDYDQGSPEDLTLDTKSLSKTFVTMLTGAKIGSRIATVTKASNIFGSGGNAQLGVGNDDPLLIIVDLVAPAVDKPTDVTPDKLPKLQLKKGKPSGFDFTGIAQPDQYGDLLRTTLKQGTGATVAQTDSVTVNYLGEVYQGTKPFDQSYVDVPKSATAPAKKAAPVTFPLSQVVKGWTLGLTGVKVGSRVLLQIPPVLGYVGKAQANIPANSTLYFVVDVIKATPASASAAPSAPAQ